MSRKQSVAGFVPRSWWNLESPPVLLVVLLVGGGVTIVTSVLLLGATLAVTAGLNPMARFVALLVVLAVTVTVPIFLVGRSPPLVEVR